MADEYAGSTVGQDGSSNDPPRIWEPGVSIAIAKGNVSFRIAFAGPIRSTFCDTLWPVFQATFPVDIG